MSPYPRNQAQEFHQLSHWLLDHDQKGRSFLSMSRQEVCQ